MIGYVYSNGDGTWLVERKGQKVPDTYNSIDQAATALMALASKRPVVAKRLISVESVTYAMAEREGFGPSRGF